MSSNENQKQAEPEIRVINEEYERILGNPDGMIVSDSLMGVLPAEMFSSADPGGLTDNHRLTVTITDASGEDNTAFAHGSLHSLSSTPSNEMCVVLSVRGNYNILLQVLNDSMAGEDELLQSTSKIQLAGDNGFKALGVEIMGWSLTKVKSHDFLLTINFRGSDVIF